ncbi:MAG: hypothetical protein V1859_10750 [archaeon]
MQSVEDFIKGKKEKFKSSINKKIYAEKGHAFIKEAITIMQKTEYPNRIFIIERLSPAKRNDAASKIKYRFGYFTKGKNGYHKGKWAWNLFFSIMPLKDFHKLMQLAEKEGTILEK